MKVYIVTTMGHIDGVYSTKEKAEEVRKLVQWGNELSGSHEITGIVEKEVED